MSKDIGSFSESTRRCFRFARSEARSFGRDEVTPEHLLLGVLREKPSLVSSRTLQRIERTLEVSERASARIASTADLRLSGQALRVIAEAKVIARKAGRQEIRPEDLFTSIRNGGIQREVEELASRLLREDA